VDSAPAELPEGFGTVSTNFGQGELFLSNKEGDSYRLSWGAESSKDDQVRALPAGVYDLRTYRIVSRVDGEDWHLSGSAPSIKKVKVEAGENLLVKLEDTIHMGSHIGGGRAQMSITGDSGSGLSIYRAGKRIPIGYRILNKSGDVVASGDMRYG
jgi:hypothetical protein